MNTTERPTPRTNAAYQGLSDESMRRSIKQRTEMQRIERELAEASERAASKHGCWMSELRRTSELERENEAMRAAIQQTLMENLHLADGDVCTLKRLKDAIGFSLPKTPCQPSK